LVCLRLGSVLLLLGVVTIVTISAPYGYVMSQSYTTFTSFTTSTNMQLSTIYSTGAIPPAQTDDNSWTCYYSLYQLHVDASIKEVDVTISASSPVNYYIMSKNQYNQFVELCGSSYPSLELKYSSKSYALKWTPPAPGDYYIILENTSASAVTYNMQLALIRFQS
jgi:hypothetical protein